MAQQKPSAAAVQEAQEPKKETPQAAQQFEGKLVRKLRNATIGDAFFMEGSDQVVVSLEDGTERTIRRKELTEAPK